MASALNSDTIAALDIGTNSFHMVVAKIVDQGFEVIAREKENVRIGHGAGEMKELSPEAIERGITCLQRMQQVAQSLNADIVAVATSAVREAKNKGDFLRRARKESGIATYPPRCITRNWSARSGDVLVRHWWWVNRDRNR
jgi:exopolyphosphatase/guanosine-5'-triphosphate,3'-diphosphate pyrophosphatase